jgi:hypothetical protein
MDANRNRIEYINESFIIDCSVMTTCTGSQAKHQYHDDLSKSSFMVVRLSLSLSLSILHYLVFLYCCRARRSRSSCCGQWSSVISCLNLECRRHLFTRYCAIMCTLQNILKRPARRYRKEQLTVRFGSVL